MIHLKYVLIKNKYLVTIINEIGRVKILKFMDGGIYLITVFYWNIFRKIFFIVENKNDIQLLYI